MAGQINISGSTEAVQLHGNDSYTVARDFTFPDASGELLIKDANDNVEQGINNIEVYSINGGPLAGMRNRFINGSMQVVQRGAAGAAGVTRAMTCDRWYVHNDAAQTYTWDQVTAVAAQQAAGFRKALRVRNASDTYQFRQLIELSEAGARDDFIEGSTWTVSIYSTAELDYQVQWRSDRDGESVGSTISVVPATAMTETPAGSGRYVGTFTFPTGSAAPDNTTIALGVSFLRSDGGTGATQVTGAQFEPGPVATMFEMRPIGIELGLCQRYYQRLDGCSYTFNWTGTSSSDVQVPLKVTMRDVPDLSVDNVTGLIGTSPTIGGATADMARISAGATAENKRARFRLSADAEL